MAKQVQILKLIELTIVERFDRSKRPRESSKTPAES